MIVDIGIGVLWMELQADLFLNIISLKLSLIIDKLIQQLRLHSILLGIILLQQRIRILQNLLPVELR